METAITLAFQLAVLVFSVVIHEVAHGLTANALGDPTAKDAGRLTLNPIRHLDPVGSVLVPAASLFLGGIIFGWAKPVPYNPYNLRVSNREFGGAIVGAAGPAANVAVAVIFGLALRTAALWSSPLDPSAALPLLEIARAIVIVNVTLAVFNLVPIPPLDGSKVLFALLPARWVRARLFLEQAGFLLLLRLIVLFSAWIAPVVRLVVSLISGPGS